MSYFDVKVERERLEIKKGASALVPVSITNVGSEAYDTKVRVEGQRAGSASWYKVLDREHKPVEMKTLQPKDNVTYYLQAQIPEDATDPNDTLEVIAYDVENSGSVWNASGKLELVFKDDIPDPPPWWIWVVVGVVGLGLVGVIVWLLLSGDKFVPQFEASPMTGPAPLAVQFTDSSTPRDPAPESWEWTFGDGGPVSTEQNPAHTYEVPGTYTVQLKALWPSGGSDKVNGGRFYREIVVTQPPQSEFSALPDKGRSPLEVRFSDTSSGSVASWEWDFGDGSPKSTEQSPAHTFTNPTAQDIVRTVTLRVTDQQGASATSTATVTVQPESEVRLVIVRDGQELKGIKGYAPLTVQFRDKSVNLASALWDFGDQSTTTTTNPSHKYETPGNYVATLTNLANNAKDTVQVDVYTRPELTVSPSSTEITREEEVTFNLTGTGDFESNGAILDFGDNSNQIVTVPRPASRSRVRDLEITPLRTFRKLITHKYTKSGTFDVKLTVVGKAGDSISRTVRITVKPKPGDSDLRIHIQPMELRRPVILPGNG